MTSPSKKKPPLVAQRRYSDPTKTASVKKKTTAKKRKPAKSKRAKPKGFLGRLWLRIYDFFVAVIRLIFRFSLRLGLVLATVLIGFVLFYAVTLPPVEDQLDARARGSVTFLDRDRQVFTWRGERIE